MTQNSVNKSVRIHRNMFIHHCPPKDESILLSAVGPYNYDHERRHNFLFITQRAITNNNDFTLNTDVGSLMLYSIRRSYHCGASQGMGLWWIARRSILVLQDKLRKRRCTGSLEESVELVIAGG